MTSIQFYLGFLEFFNFAKPLMPLLTLCFRSMSTISFMDEPHGEHVMHPPVRMENTFQLQPQRRFPDGQVRNIIRDVLEGYLSEERYEPELCRQMTKTLSEVIQSYN